MIIEINIIVPINFKKSNFFQEKLFDFYNIYNHTYVVNVARANLIR